MESHKHINGIVNDSQETETYEEGSVRSSGVDGSIGSDVDKNEVNGLISKDSDGQDTIPRYTVKKTMSFKPANVTKNFLMKAGSTSVLPKSSVDKGKRCHFCHVSNADSRPRQLIIKLGRSRIVSTWRSSSLGS